MLVVSSFVLLETALAFRPRTCRLFPSLCLTRDCLSVQTTCLSSLPFPLSYLRLPQCSDHMLVVSSFVLLETALASRPRTCRLFPSLCLTRDCLSVDVLVVSSFVLLETALASRPRTCRLFPSLCLTRDCLSVDVLVVSSFVLLETAPASRLRACRVSSLPFVHGDSSFDRRHALLKLLCQKLSPSFSHVLRFCCVVYLFVCCFMNKFM